MKLKSSYIFLPNPYKKKVEKPNENVITIGKNVFGFIKQVFPFIEETKGYGDLFKKKYTGTITNERKHYMVEFLINKVVDNTYLDVTVEAKSKAQVVKTLEYMQDTIESSGILNEYIMIISYDAVSEYYCNKIYPKLNKLERTLRQLLFNTYIVNCGHDYYKTTTRQDLQDKVKGVIQAKGSRENKEIELLKNFFYAVEFIDIQNLLFSFGWTDFDEKAKSKFLAEHGNLSELSDEVLRKAFTELTPRSDWERFFSNKIVNINVQDVIEYIRKQRNNIAHCKFFKKKEYDRCSKAINNLNKAIISAIALTEEKDFHDKNSESLRKSFAAYDQWRKEYEEQIKVIFAPINTTMEPIRQQIEKLNTTMEPIRSSIKSHQSFWKLYDFSTMQQGLEEWHYLDTYSEEDSDENDNNKDENTDIE